ncbi:23S rRNA pseudouridylate synthase [Buchnera aphidicola (Schlechtendalia chinensis)]|uniref:Pseudouridine synthase n=1 Tax=Buchnera aphidicola subsp. Schlechtendalia chinensis TaxID=118110 RepID=A0A172WDT4_BUCSC|nr:23S rRNA pseudouridine(1911/1915/1917) synthase RluD [Buchnera aphidicola]ANF17133.1 23S rRNA pseudouridylate synthase [Buchnera aphidicola (Schlechtendalia chinensis)]
MINFKKFTVIVSNTFSKKTRLDKVLSKLFSQYSRTCIKKWIVNFRVNVNGKIFDKPNMYVSYGDKIIVSIVNESNNFDSPQNISLCIVYEDKDILVIDKQTNLVVHPGAGNKCGTLLNALLYRNSSFMHIPRSGIVHRLDKNTTGLMIIGKNIISYNALIELMRSRKIIRQYETVVHGRMISGGTIIRPIARHPTRRTIMTVSTSGKKAITHYRVIKRFSYHTHLRVKLETGRTHQIRVHMLDIHYPLIGDPIYGKKYQSLKNISKETFKMVKEFPRQALHSSKLCLKHPITGVQMKWNSCLPNDMLHLLKQLNKNDIEQFNYNF